MTYTSSSSLLESPGKSNLVYAGGELQSAHWLWAVCASSLTVQMAISCCCRWVWLVPVITPQNDRTENKPSVCEAIFLCSTSKHQLSAFHLLCLLFLAFVTGRKKLPRGWERTDSCGFCGFCDTCGNPASWPNKKDYKYEFKRYIPVGAQPVFRHMSLWIELYVLHKLYISSSEFQSKISLVLLYLYNFLQLRKNLAGGALQLTDG